MGERQRGSARALGDTRQHTGLRKGTLCARRKLARSTACNPHTERCCRQHNKNQIVHTSQVLLSHGARLVHRNLRGTRSSRCRATADSTRMTSGSRHAPHFSLGHDSRPPPRCARFVETKKNDIDDETAEQAPLPAMPDVPQETL